MKFIDWFAGIGGFRRGMELCGHECVGFCEFDKYAVMSYTSMHLITEDQRAYLATLDLKARQKEILKEEYRNGEWYANDVRTVDARSLPDADCWCFGFPCQDISVAGKQLGFTGNRSSLFFRIMYILGQLEEEKKPTYLFIENVKNLLSVNGGWDFARLLVELDKGGYDAEWQVLNSKYFGVPQNRERCFIIGHLRGRSGSEVFPFEGTNGEDCVCRIVGHRDGYRRNMQVFDPDGVTETLDTGQGGGRGHHTIIALNKDYKHRHEAVLDNAGISGTVMARDYKGPQRVAIPIGVIDDQGRNTKKVVPKQVAGTLRSETHGNVQKVVLPVLTPERANKRQNGRRFKENGEESFTLTAQDRHGVGIEITPIGGVYTSVSPAFQRGVYKNCFRGLKAEAHDCGAAFKVEVKEATKQGYAICRGGRDSVNFTMPRSKTRRGRVGVDIANTLDTSCNQGIFVEISPDLTVYAVWYPKEKCYIAIRKLTPKECFRLQGWTDDYFDKATFVNSNSQLYKQAGNGVTVNVIKAISERMKL